MKGFLDWFKNSSKMKRWIFIILLGVILTCYGLAEVLLVESVLTIVSILKIVASFVVGFTLIVIGIVCMQKRTLEILIEASDGRVQDKDNVNLKSLIFNKKVYAEGPNIVVLGGGDGLNTVIQGLKKYTSNITAIVTVSSYGKMQSLSRKDLNVLPVDDIKESIIALSDNDEIMNKLLNLEFKSGKLKNISFADIYFSAVKALSGDFSTSISNSNKIFNMVGKVLPVTNDEMKICAELDNGMVVEDKDKIPQIVYERVTKINRVYISPTNCRASQEVTDAIKNADCIVIAPGSLYTNVIPNLLVNGVVKAIKESRAIKTYVCNIMTEPGQTDNYGISDHINAIIDHVGQQDIIDFCICDNGEVVPEFIKKYNLEGSDLVEQDANKIKSKKVQVIQRKLSMINDDDKIRHNPNIVASTIIDLICEDMKFKDKQMDPQYMMLKVKNEHEKKINKEQKSKKVQKFDKDNTRAKQSKFALKYGNRMESIKNTDANKKERLRIMKEAEKLEESERKEFLKSMNMDQD